MLDGEVEQYHALLIKTVPASADEFAQEMESLSPSYDLAFAAILTANKL